MSLERGFILPGHRHEFKSLSHNSIYTKSCDQATVTKNSKKQEARCFTSKPTLSPTKRSTSIPMAMQILKWSLDREMMPSSMQKLETYRETNHSPRYVHNVMYDALCMLLIAQYTGTGHALLNLHERVQSDDLFTRRLTTRPDARRRDSFFSSGYSTRVYPFGKSFLLLLSHHVFAVPILTLLLFRMVATDYSRGSRQRKECHDDSCGAKVGHGESGAGGKRSAPPGSD
jgi:hypothetical protein